jgi:UDP-2,3-diacylglucosamine hydrolase
MALPLPTQPPVLARMQRYFIADLHLNGLDTDHALKFREFLKKISAEAATRPTELYILGDLFEFWYEYHVQLFAIYHKDLEALEAAWHAGVNIYLFYGNRDFAYGKYVRSRFGATILGDGEKIMLSDTRPAWLEHGDLLCTSDRSYLRFRAVIRSFPVRVLFWLMPWSLSLRMIEKIRNRTNADKKTKSQKTLEIDIAAARRRLEGKDCRVLLCGHTHQPKAEDLGAGYRLIVLPAWCQQAGGFVDDGLVLRPF